MSAITARLTWTPSFNAVVLAEASSLYLPAATDFDITTGDFRIVVALWPDSTIGSPTSAKDIVSKYDGDLSSDTGWRLYYKPSDGTVGFEINDGDASSTNISTTGKITNDAWNLIVVEADRSANATIYVNGVSAVAGSITGKASTLSGAERVTISQSNSLKGYVSLFALEEAVYGSAWCLKEYYRMKYGWPRNHNGFGVWTFSDSLVDENSSYAMVYAPSGFPTYLGSGFPSTCTIDFFYQAGSAYGFLPLDAVIRTKSSLDVHPIATKKFHTLNINSNNSEIIQACVGAWHSRSLVDFYEDTDEPMTFQGYIVAPPQLRRMHGSFEIFTLYLEEA